MQAISDPKPEDCVLIWNRYHSGDAEARRFESAGATVLVAENGYVRDGLPGKWFALAKTHHSGAGAWHVGPPDRLVAWGLDFAPYRTDGRELVILAQRGIGEPGIAAPRGWADDLHHRIGGRIRPHPGLDPASARPLADDLRHAYAVVTWGSAAGLSAMLAGIPVIAAFPRWIGAMAGIPLVTYLTRTAGQKRSSDAARGREMQETRPFEPLNRCESDRLEVFRRVAWAQWSLNEIESGTAYRHLLHPG